MSKLYRAVLIAVLVLAVGREGAAQSAPLRDGFFSTIGIGFASSNFSCSQGCEDGRQAGVGGFFGIGSALSQAFIVGVELDLFYWGEPQQADTWIGTVTVFGQWYPWPRGGFFVKGGLGIGGAQVSQLSPTGVDSRTKTGLGYMLAAGYDIRIGPFVALTPVVTVYGASLGTVDSVTGVSTNVIEAALALSFF